MLKNKEADLWGRITTFEQYIKIGFDADKSLSMAGFKEIDIHQNPILLQ